MQGSSLPRTSEEHSPCVPALTEVPPLDRREKEAAVRLEGLSKFPSSYFGARHRTELLLLGLDELSLELRRWDTS
jgi:hypothetical protein